MTFTFSILLKIPPFGSFDLCPKLKLQAELIGQQEIKWITAKTMSNNYPSSFLLWSFPTEFWSWKSPHEKVENGYGNEFRSLPTTSPAKKSIKSPEEIASQTPIHTSMVGHNTQSHMQVFMFCLRWLWAHSRFFNVNHLGNRALQAT